MNKKENPFIDREKAIENLGGNATLYEKHLRKFRVKYAVSDQEMKELLQLGDLEEAEILAHSIKGLSGTLGLSYLSSASAHLEHALKTGVDFSEPLMQFQEKLHDVIHG